MLSTHRLTIAGLGPGRRDLVPEATISRAKSASKVLLRTSNHPAVQALVDAGIHFETFDHLYDTSSDFDRLYDLIADSVLDAARAGETVYMVPGNPLLAERTVEILLGTDEGRKADIVPAIGFAEAVLMALKKPAASGYALVDAYDVVNGRLDRGPSPAVPTIVFQTHDPLIMSAVKLWLLDHLSPDYQVFIVDGAGSGEGERVAPVPLEELDRAGNEGPLTSVYVPAPPRPAFAAKEEAGDSAASEAIVERIQEDTGEDDAEDDADDDGAAWVRFLEVLAELRGEHGCPWDKEQTYESLTHFVLEEANEVVAAALEKDANKLQEELGDLLLEIGLYAQIARERGDFQPVDVLSGIIGKLVRRHPHVFGDETLLTPGEVEERWAQIKRGEPGRYEEGHSLMDEVQKGLPALMKAQKQQSLAGKVGFDWESAGPVFDKVNEELDELRQALASGSADEVSGEMGDLLFACVNLARKIGVDAETALLGTVGKFARRFKRIEHYLAEQGISMKGQTLEFLDTLWEKAKDEEEKEEGSF